MDYKLIIPGEAPVKKNARKQAFTRKDKATGVYKSLNFPISYYSKEYNEWAWIAIQYLKAWKKKNIVITLEGEYVCTMWFFRSTSFNTSGKKGRGSGQTIDLQNLYDSILDCLAGNSGIAIPKKLNMEHSDYQIITDDSFAFIRSHGASHIFYDPINPRTEVFLTPFRLDMLTKSMEIFHPRLKAATPDEVMKESQSVDYIYKDSKDLKLDFNLDNFLKE